MQEVHTHRGFVVTVLAEDDPAGGSSVTTRIEPSKEHPLPDDGTDWSAPHLARSPYRGAAAIGAAFDEARRQIDAALGDPDPIED
ncbi:hypothetical protein J2797_003957 [Paraburkholderia terricola]|uniref:hypothetical protein n=1 Tax=Paraburkholderia terricola TaxID=169427 RepID=UPI002865066F|nr:hypothetical protein [Paraburkholderia terricola]MDR6494054.1 hypothetical protein [Paraburkholderia terricola]